MSNMIFYPQGVNPQGLQKVYYCGHPSDFDRCFEIVRKDIFGAVQDRTFVLCHDRSPEEPPDENFYVDLGQMKMFVVPVTYRFLTTPSRARDVEIPFALENCIAVLPLMLDHPTTEVICAFNKIFGNIQFLYKYDSDKTSIPYGEKLKNFLSELILDDNTAKRVREAFDAYVFLSYRKKDRKYAKKLMQLIHENDFCRDVAIWYDEFLTLGEDFNENIRQALDKSVLFALAVTPNLVNEENYVMNVEFPSARDSGKPILPVEMVQTPRSRLKSLYKGIPKTTKASRPRRLTKALLRTLDAVALQENRADPVHTFFIGLAYLTGIDVEVDCNRALTLITSAAESGVLEAMDKLSSMYYNGEGVVRNYNTSVCWYEKVVECYKRKYELCSSAENGLIYSNSLFRLGNKVYECRNLDKAHAIFEKMYGFCTLLTECYSDSWVIRSQSVAKEKIGMILEEQQDFFGAEKSYRQAVELCKVVIMRDDFAEATRDLTVILTDLGRVSYLMGDARAAEKYYLEVLKMTEQKSNLDASTEALLDLTCDYCSAGDALFASGDIHAAEQYYRKAFSVDELLLNREETPQVLRSLAISYSKLGNIARYRGDLCSAEEYYRKDFDICKSLAEKYMTTETYDDWAVSHCNLASVVSWEDARAYLHYAKFIWNQLIEQCPEMSIFQQRRDAVVAMLNSDEDL